MDTQSFSDLSFLVTKKKKCSLWEGLGGRSFSYNVFNVNLFLWSGIVCCWCVWLMKIASTFVPFRQCRVSQATLHVCSFPSTVWGKAYCFCFILFCDRWCTYTQRQIGDVIYVCVCVEWVCACMCVCAFVWVCKALDSAVYCSGCLHTGPRQCCILQWLFCTQALDSDVYYSGCFAQALDSAVYYSGCFAHRP